MGLIQSHDAQRVCGLSGVQGKLYSQKLITLKDLEKTLVLALQEADSAIRGEQFWSKALVCAKVIKVICDVTVDLLSNTTGFAGKGVSMIYDRATLVADGLNASSALRHVGEVHVDVAGEVLANAGKGTAAGVLGHAKLVLKTGESVLDVYEAAQEAAKAGGGIEGARRSLMVQMASLQRQIAFLEKELAACGLQ